MLCFGVASAGGILLGNVMGEGNLEKAKEYASKLLKLTVVTGAVGGCISDWNWILYFGCFL